MLFIIVYGQSFPKEQRTGQKPFAWQVMAGYGRLGNICHSYTSKIIRRLNLIYGRWQVFDKTKFPYEQTLVTYKNNKVNREETK